MSLQDELKLPNEFQNRAHEAVINIVLTGALLSKEGDRVLRSHGLTDAWFNVLILLRHQAPQGYLKQSDIGHMLVVNRSNVTGLVDRMEKAGLVRRVPDPDDRRVNYVEMTDSGCTALESARSEYYQRIEDVMSGLGESNLSNINRSLESVRVRCRKDQQE